MEYPGVEGSVCQSWQEKRDLDPMELAYCLLTDAADGHATEGKVPTFREENAALRGKKQPRNGPQCFQ